MYRVSIVLAGFLLAGCATMVNGTSQDIAVLATPAGATCKLSNDSGHWQVIAPGTVRVTRSSSDLVVRCAAPGYIETTQTYAAQGRKATEYGYSRDPNYIDAPLQVVDLATGANRFYPDKIEITLLPAHG